MNTGDCSVDINTSEPLKIPFSHLTFYCMKEFNKHFVVVEIVSFNPV